MTDTRNDLRQALCRTDMPKGQVTLLKYLYQRACHRIVLVVARVFGASSSETVEPVLTAAVRSEPRDGR